MGTGTHRVNEHKDEEQPIKLSTIRFKPEESYLSKRISLNIPRAMVTPTKLDCGAINILPATASTGTVTVL